MIRLARFLLALTVLATALVPGTALAVANPDSLSIKSTRVFRHLIETDDYLLVVHYDIAYATLPDEPASDTYLVRLLNGSTELGAAVPYALNDSGYNQGVVSFYFSAADAPAWGGAYDVVLTGNPTQFTSPPSVTETLVSADYSTDNTESGNQTLLGNHLLSIATDLENSGYPDLTTGTVSGTLLNSNGQFYYGKAIPGLVNMAPQIFSTQTTSPTFADTTWGRTEEANMNTRFNGVAYLNDAFQGVADWWGTPAKFVSGLMVSGFGLWIMWKSRTWTGDIRPGALAASLMFLVAGWMGLVAVQLVFVGVFGLLFLIVYSLWLRFA